MRTEGLTEGLVVSRGAGTCIVEHVFDGQEGYAHGPERALMSAMLFDGVQAYLSYFASGSGTGRSRYQEAYNWVHDKSVDYIFSFENVCEAVGVDAECLRLGLLNVCKSQERLLKKLRKAF